MPIFSQAPSTRFHRASCSEKAKPNEANGDWLLFRIASQNNEIDIAKGSYNSKDVIFNCFFVLIVQLLRVIMRFFLSTHVIDSAMLQIKEKLIRSERNTN